MTITACGQTIDPHPGSFDGTTGEFEPGLLDPGECLTFEQTGVYGYKHQCGGAFFASVGGTYDEQSFVFYVPYAGSTPFGDGVEPYEQAKVIACCGEYDSEKDLEEQPAYAENCLADFRQQACMSISAGLKTLIDDGTVPFVYKNKATEVQKWLAARTTECMVALENNNTTSWFNWLSSVWELPNNGPWAPHLTDVYVEIHWAVITDVHLPATPETCESLNTNDTIVFTDQSGTPFVYSYDLDLDEGDGNLVGPIYGGSSISGSGDFASLSTSCSDPYCSTVSFSVSSSLDFAIDSMVLYVDGPLNVSNGTINETITDARIELYKQALGSGSCPAGSPCTFTVPAGDAHFIVVGVADGDVATLALSSSTDITATVNSVDDWSLDSFQIEYVDDSSDTWTLTVNSSEWLYIR